MLDFLALRKRATRGLILPVLPAIILIAVLPVVADAQWTDAATGLVADTLPSRGASWVDFDGDGDLDLFVANNGPNRLLRNDGEDPGSPGDWLFTDVAADMGAPLDNSGRGSVGLWGDYDNDGDLDVFLSIDVGANFLFRNDPFDPGDPLDTDRVFVDVTAGDVGSTLSSQSASWADFDGDGDIDLYVCNREGNLLLRNDGVDPLDDGQWVFTNIAPLDGSGIGDDSSTQAGVWADFDNDGDLDLFLSNSSSADRLLRNDGFDAGDPDSWLFTDVAAGTSLADTGLGRGAAWIDFDNDGDLDLYSAIYGSANRLYRNDPDGMDRVFVDIAAAAGVDDAGNTRGLGWADFDEDGDSDLYIINSDDGNVLDDNRLLRNDGFDPGDPEGWLFTDVTDTLLADDGSYSAATAFGDYDGDGDLDIFVANWNPESPNILLRNDIPDTNHWIHVLAQGVNSNADGVGARLRLVAGGLTQHREVIAGEGLMSQGSPAVEFGIGAATVIDTLEIDWPSGASQIITTLAADQFFAVVEPGPTPPTPVAEPIYTAGTVNNVDWSDESASGAVEYRIQLADGLDFADIIEDSGWIAATTYAFIDLDDGLRGYYRVRSRDSGAVESRWSQAVASVQDSAPPVSNVAVLTDPQPGDPFSIDFEATDLGSGVALVSLFYKFESSPNFSFFATHVDGDPFLFTVPNGPGVYSFYTVAEDNLGQLEAAPLVPDITITVNSPPWVNVAPTDGTLVGSNGNGRGVAWGDYDQDGRHDLFVTNRPVWYTGADPSNHLYHNDGPDVGNPDSWLFSDVTADPLDDPLYSQGVSWADYDGDGDLDLYQANMQVSAGYLAPNRLYRNEGGGVFVDMASAAGVNDGGSGRTVSWCDYDQDGDIDLYLANDGPNRLFRNEGDGTFTNVAPDSTGVGDDLYTMGCAWGDFDNDGDPDLYVVNYNEGANRLFRNDGEDPGMPGEWIFTDVAVETGVADTGSGLAAAWGDFDNDGWLDLYLANKGDNRLYRSVGQTAPAPGSPFFEDVTEVSGTTLTDGQYGTGVAWADYDNDGDLDFFLGNHWPDTGPEYAVNQLFRNDGPAVPSGWSFVNVAPTNGVGISDSLSTNGAAWSDFDDDGDLDLYFANMTAGPNKLFRNDVADSTDNHWLHLDLVANQANTAAIGARVRAVAGGVSQIREVDGGSGFLSQPSLTIEFGLGAATMVDTLYIDWPGDSWQVMFDVAVDQRITVTEDDMTAVGDLLPQQRALALYQNHPNPFNPITTIRFDLPTEQRVSLKIYALDGSLVAELTNQVLPAGRNEVVWRGRDSQGRSVGSGVYLYRLHTEDGIRNKRMLLLK